MKLKFTKDEDGEILLTMNGKKFDTNHYLEIVKNIKDEKELELDDFDETISQGEQESIKEMIKEINLISTRNEDENLSSNEDSKYSESEDINPDDIPF